ncbi:uncharacterized protein RAG0_07517 [Rhynchosporium agropyri]|uniref:Uncharacterized protein n=1 Tax=Rhynchosporium agropyri TaxID=914238 RepID=A0A1E1KLU7_9HELO|nr:uncharacterized protein RAG0_07517 [Rhynchosporium agropyri]
MGQLNLIDEDTAASNQEDRDEARPGKGRQGNLSGWSTLAVTMDKIEGFTSPSRGVV